MPLLGDQRSERSEKLSQSAHSPPLLPTTRSQSQHSNIAKTAMSSQLAGPQSEPSPGSPAEEPISYSKEPSCGVFDHSSLPASEVPKQKPCHGSALTDTPASTAPSSPKMWVCLFRSLFTNTTSPTLANLLEIYPLLFSNEFAPTHASFPFTFLPLKSSCF